MPGLNDARLKIKRANKHISDAKERIELVTGPEGQTSRHEVDPQSKTQTIHYELTRLDELPNIALIVGDGIHNLKTAMDYGWNHLMTDSASGIGVTKFSKFPVYPTCNALEAALKSNGLDASWPALFNLMLTNIKPYHGGDEFIYAIHKYDIADKHRLLIPTTNYGNVSGIEVDDQTDAWTLGGELSKRFKVLLIGNMQVKNEGRITLEIVFKDGPLKGLELIESLQIFSSRVLRIIELFENL